MTVLKMKKEKYETLTFIKGNRRTQTSYVNKKRKEIEAEDKLPDTREWILEINEKNEIVDGQCHWEAIMQYNQKHPKKAIKEISYILRIGADLDTAKEVNNKNTRWKDSDLIQSWIDLGHEDFIPLQRILTTPEAKTCGRTLVFNICNILDDKNVHKKIVDGTFTMQRKEDDAMDLIRCVAACKKSLHDSFGHRTVSIPVFLRCLLVKDIDRGRLVERVKRPNLKLKGFQYSNKEDDILQDIELVYNEKIETVKRVDILDCYKDVVNYNRVNAKNARKLPLKKLPLEEEDNGVIPV